MPTIALPLDGGRPIVEVQVGVPAALARALCQAGRTVPVPLRLPAMLDTGASRSCVNYRVRRRLALRPFSWLNLSTPSSGRSARAARMLYKVNLAILHPAGPHLTRGAFTVAAVPLKHLGVEVLIGRDLLALLPFPVRRQGRKVQAALLSAPRRTRSPRREQRGAPFKPE
jgi:hypothetical protein